MSVFIIGSTDFIPRGQRADGMLYCDEEGLDGKWKFFKVR